MLAWRSAFVVLFAAALLYPALATPAKVRDRFDVSAGRTLDGMAFMERAVYSDKDVAMPLADDLAAMRWMLAELPGSPVVAEVNTSPKLYGWGNRFAMFTGNPAVIGWDFHERQQRGRVADEEITQRIRDVQRAYETPDANEAFRLLSPLRRSLRRRRPAGARVLPGARRSGATGAGRLWEPVFRQGEVSRLSPRPRAAGCAGSARSRLRHGTRATGSAGLAAYTMTGGWSYTQNDSSASEVGQVAPSSRGSDSNRAASRKPSCSSRSRS